MSAKRRRGDGAASEDTVDAEKHDAATQLALEPFAPGVYKAKALGFGVSTFQYFSTSRPNPDVTRDIPANAEVTIVAVHDGPPRFYQLREGDWIIDSGVAPGGGFGAPPVLDLGTHKVQPGPFGSAQKALAAPKEQPVKNVMPGEEVEVVAACADGPDLHGVIWLQTKEGHWVDQAALEGGAMQKENFGGGYDVPSGPSVWPAGQGPPVSDDPSRNVVFS